MKKSKIILLVAAILIILFLLVLFPLQKLIANKKYNSYITVQRINSSDIASRQTIWDWKNGGFLTIAKYYSDEDNIYYYRYNIFNSNSIRQYSYEGITLNIVNEKEGYELDAPYEGKCKYPPVK